MKKNNCKKISLINFYYNWASPAYPEITMGHLEWFIACYDRTFSANVLYYDLSAFR